MATRPFVRIKPKKVSEEIESQIRSYILNGTLQPGERLPSERELAESLGVSRPPLREALNTLQSEGLIEIQHGNRTYVRPITTRSIYDPLVAFCKKSSRNILQVAELRKHLEIGAVTLAAQRATPLQVKKLEKVTKRLEEDIANDRLGAKSDLEFHAEIAKMTGNYVYIHVLMTVYDLLQAEMRIAWGTVFNNAESKKVLLNHHRNIFVAIKNKDPEAGRKYCLDHLDYVYVWWARHLRRNGDDQLSNVRKGAVKK